MVRINKLPRDLLISFIGAFLLLGIGTGAVRTLGYLGWGCISGPNPPILGTNRPDTLEGTANTEAICGLNGNDKIDALPGDDVVEGGEGNDVINGDQGADRILGGLGNDVITGGADNDWLIGDVGHDNLDGGDGNDKIDGFTGNDVINGGNGNDQIIGDTGADKIFGGDGNDEIYHGQWLPDIDDMLRSDGKKDVIDCGPGIDQVIINEDVDGDVAINCESVIAG
jgi:Ca2+-binding RTX toxin-like protein